MNEKQFLKKLNKIMAKFEKQVHMPLVDLVNEYKDTNEFTSLYNLSYKEEFKKLDDMALLTGWVIDRIDDKEGFINSPTYKKSLTKKIRKALGFTF